ncbi:MAG: 30S ribosomal protein S9 [uncultured bacterium]|nr:MAG: 30S ribosomal protein S9 [uncultured bacterium]
MPRKKIEKISKEVTEKSTKVVKKAEKHSYYFGVGRRKSAVARVKLHLDGDKSFKINNRDIAQYFPGELAKTKYLEPFKATSNLNRFTVEAKIIGSGLNGQLGALVHALGRALDKLDTEKYHLLLRRKGFLTRDPRTRERRKVGTGGKARRQKQSPKR